jgi:hypothetical protein
MRGCGLDSSGSRQGTLADYCEHGNETLDAIKCWKFLVAQNLLTFPERFDSVEIFSLESYLKYPLSCFPWIYSVLNECIVSWYKQWNSCSTYFRGVKVKVMLRPTVSRPVRLGVKPHLGPKIMFLLLSDSCGFGDVGRPLWREDGSAVYNCCWPSPRQSFLGISPTGLTTISGISDSRLPQPGGLGPHLYIPQAKGGPVIPQALGTLFVASYDSQDCGGIGTRLHTGMRDVM